MASEKGIIGICGSGLIGRGWAILFAGAGYRVNLYDLNADQLSDAVEDIEKKLHELKENGMLRGTLAVREQLQLIRGVRSLEECVHEAAYIQECIPESLQMKKELFQKLDSLVGPHTILASSTSSISPSTFTAELVNKERCIVSHPINPPYYIRLVEIVPAPSTSQDVMVTTRKLMEEIGQVPISFSREIPGFGINRIQQSIMNEAYHLAAGGILTVADVDKLMVEGLAMRYAWQGPFETVHLLANGIATVIDHFGPSFRSLNQTLKPPPMWEGEEIKAIINQMNEIIPEDKIEERRSWRNERLVSLAKLKNDMKNKEK